MPSAYGRAFAGYYNTHWRAFAEQTAPRLLAWYAATPPGRQRLPVLDLGCGTGQLAAHFLAAGFAVTGLDLSPEMLAHAARNNAAAVAAGRARFVQGDAAHFAFDHAFGLIASTFDTLNHLPDLDALRGCFRSARAVLAPGGYFVFDLNTRLGLQGWNSLNIYEHDGTVLIQRRQYAPGASGAVTTLTGFVPAADGGYERFDETITNTAFAVSDVLAALAECGWPTAHTATLADLNAPLADPEAQSRVYFVASGEPITL
jgi:SAM-dependent methyltransferase